MARVSRGIVISASEYSRPFFNDCITSIKTNYPIYVCWEGIGRPEGSFELGAIRKGAELFDEFIYIHDTVVIKDNSLFDKLFSTEGHVLFTNKGYHYFGKYVSNDLPEIPEVKNKADAIHWEIRWFTKPHKIFIPELPFHVERFEEKHGRMNMVIESDYLIKYKATWK